MKHQEKLAKIIEEFEKTNKLLKDYSINFSEVTSEISDLESELILWEKEKQDLQKNPANKEEVETWQNQINEIKTNINEKKAYLQDLQKEIDDLNCENQNLRKNVKIIEKQQIEFVFNQIGEFQEISGDDQYLNKFKEGIISNLKLLKDLWEIQGKEHNLAKFIKLFKSKNQELDLKILYELFNKSKEYLIPQIITEFLDAYLEDYDIKNIVDPSCKIGSLMFRIRNQYESNLTAFLEDSDDEEVISLIYPNKIINFKTGLEELQEFPDNYFDIVVGFGENNKIERNDFDNIQDTKHSINFLQTLLKLKEDGFGFCILEPEFKLNWGDNSLFTNLEKYDLNINSIIRLAPEIFSEGDSDKTLIIIRKIKPEKIFIGELNNKSSDILLENLKKRKSGKIVQHGILTELKSFYSFPNFLSNKESQFLGQSTGIEPLKFKEIVRDVRQSDKFSESDEDFNYVFLPFDYNSDVILSSQSFEFKPENYLQIFFDPEIALSDYIARFYNTQLGKKIRESLKIGFSTHEISRRLLFDSLVYLPDIDSQIEIIRVDSLISELNTIAESYRSKLWKSPSNVSEILKELEGFNEEKSEEKFEKWMESLPYPLASIIWASTTVSDYSVKVKYLLDFFEAFSEFNYALMISALSQDKKFFDNEYRRCKIFSKPVDWYLKPTFGSWNIIGICLASKISKLLNNPEKRSKCLELFGNPDPEFLERICNKELYNLLLDVMNYRNQWEAHGPRVSPKEYKNRYKIMQGALMRFYQIISDVYENSYLLIPDVSTFKDGIHYYTIKRLIGTRAPFKSDNIESISLMDSQKIYLLTKNQRKPVELLPFINIENDVCYFYNSLYDKDHENRGDLRYVSYHYSDEAEIAVEFERLEKIIDLLKLDEE